MGGATIVQLREKHSSEEEIIEMAKQCASHKTCDNCKFSNFKTDCNTVLAKYIVEKENEPAPAGTDTSSKCNELQSNNTMKLKICQEIAKNLITIQDDQMGDIYTSGYVQAMRGILMILDRF